MGAITNQSGELPVQLVIYDRDPHARTGLRSILSASPPIIVAGETGDADELEDLIRERQPDVVVLEAQPRLLAASLSPETAIVAVVRDIADAEDWMCCTQLPLRALVSRDAPAPELIAAVQAAAAGDGYISAALSGRLLSLMRSLLPRSRQAIPTHTPLTGRETEVLNLVRAGLANKEVAAILGLSEKTVKFHVSNVLAKAHMRTRGQLIAWGDRAAVRG